ncbi:MarR family protein [Halobacteriovorax sp. BALOs_7]|uniref:MarR family transcriptional regulator n=1 Tax=Halobacteriovorax vibrionivorans TaxID=2152716 RepID=A0ABY0IJJ0_9BACT|nr:MarR family protein [Halobacteriovorax sp. BALOs_7]RZF22021.1 MarR family transcriptional regulator [Halobacteriovorax vibrionivorans]TGD47115.1 MarR family transcriptional regulator [Halobacteriovorax sp. Y22]
MLVKDLAFSRILLDIMPFIVRSIRDEVKAVASPRISYPQFRALSNIGRGLTTVGELAEHHGISQPAMTKTINILVDEGLVTKKKSVEDGRLTLLSLSTKGQGLYNEVWSEVQEKISVKLKDFPIKNRKMMVSNLEKLKSIIS